MLKVSLTIHVHRQACRHHRQRAECLAMQRWWLAAIRGPLLWAGLARQQAGNRTIGDDMQIKCPVQAESHSACTQQTQQVTNAV